MVEGNVTTGMFGGSPYRVIHQFQTDIQEIIDNYVGRISTAEAIGTLEIVKLDLHRNAICG